MSSGPSLSESPKETTRSWPVQSTDETGD